MVRNVGSWHQKWREGWVCRGRAPGMGRSGLACQTVGYRLPGWARVWRRPKDAGPWALPFRTLGLPGSLLPPCPRHLHQIMKMSSPSWTLCHQWVTSAYHQAGRHGPFVTCDMRSPEVLVPVEFLCCRIWQAIYQAHCGIFYRHSIYTKRAQPGGGGHWSNIILTLNYFASSLTRQPHPMQFVISLGNKHWKQPINQSGQAEVAAAAAHGADAKEVRAAGPSSVPGNHMKPHVPGASATTATSNHRDTMTPGDVNTKLLILYHKDTESPFRKQNCWIKNLTGEE